MLLFVAHVFEPFLRNAAPFNRYKESLRETVKGRTINLEYDVTLLPSTQNLDDMKSIEKLKCTDDTVYLAVYSDFDITNLINRFELNSVLVAGKEWGCSSDSSGSPEFMHRRVLNKYVHGNEIVIKTKDCGPLDAFSEHQIEVWLSEAPPRKYELESGRPEHIKTESINDMQTGHDISGRKDTSFRSVFELPAQTEYGSDPADLSFTNSGSIDLLNQNSNIISLSWNILTQPSFYYKIQGSLKFGGMCGFVPCFAPTLVISYCKAWARVRQTTTLTASVNVRSATSTESTRQLLRKMPIPDAGVGFVVGGVGFELGFFFEAKCRASFGVDGLFQMNAGVTVITDVTSGFEYTPSSGFVPTTVISPISPTKTFTWGGKVTAVLKLGIIPVVSLNLDVKGTYKKMSLLLGLTLQVRAVFVAFVLHV